MELVVLAGKIAMVDWLGLLIFKEVPVPVQKSLKGVVDLQNKLANFWNALLWFVESKLQKFMIIPPRFSTHPESIFILNHE